MRRYSSILSFIDPGVGDLRAVETAIRLAAVSGARVTAARVIDLSPVDADDGPPKGWDVSRMEVLQTELLHLTHRLQPLSVPDVELIGKVMLGRPSLELVRDVVEHGHDLVIKVASGAQGGRRVAFGTTGLHLIRKCPAPVWLLPETAPKRPRLLAAVHPGIGGDEARYALCERVLSHAGALCRFLDAELHVAHVHEAPLGLHDAGMQRKLTQRVALTEREVLARIRGCLAATHAAATVHALHGVPEQVLPQLAQRLEVHTLLLGSLGRSGIEGLLIGDLAEELLMRVDCGVFCVKPAGFCTPVRPRSSAETVVGRSLR